MPVTNTEFYGSRSYENLILSHTPTAVFGPYASATNTITDLTNKSFLTASFASSSFTRQIPFFSLKDETYTFVITPSNKLVIKENTASFSQALGSGKFAKGDEGSEFSVEFLFSNNYDVGSSSNDFARFGFQGSQHCVGLEYNNIANHFYLKVYSVDGYIRYKSVVEGGPSKISKHIVITFKNGVPTLYVNRVKAKQLINELTNSTFIANKTSGRTVAEFGTNSESQPYAISMLAFYNYSLSERLINSHYPNLFDIGDFKNYISAVGSPLLYETLPYYQRISRNDGQGQDFYGVAVRNVIDTPAITVSTSPNFYPYGTSQSYLNRQNLTSGYGVASATGFSFKSEDFGPYMEKNGIQITFAGGGTGSYTSETPLVFFNNTSVGDIFVSVSGSTSKVVIGTGSNTILASLSSSAVQQTASTIIVMSSGSNFYIMDSDGNDTASYGFSGLIDYNQSITYLFNRYYLNTSTNNNVEVGNSLIDFTRTYAGDGENLYVALTTPKLNSASTIVWTPVQRATGDFSISMPLPEKEQNLFYVNDNSGSINYYLVIDNVSSSITKESIINIPSTSSVIYISASLNAEWNADQKNNPTISTVNDIRFYNFNSGSFVGGGYPAILESSIGVANSPDQYLNIFRQSNIGFIQTASNVIRVYKTDDNFDSIGQIDFLLGIPDLISASNQTLIQCTNNSSSMGLTYNSTSNTYLLNFTGLTASVNSIAAVSGSTKISPRAPYFIQSTFTTPVGSSSYIYLFSESNGSNQYLHSFDRVSVFPSTATNPVRRYAQVFGRRSITVSDNDPNIPRIESIPDDTLVLNKTWQVYIT